MMAHVVYAEVDTNPAGFSPFWIQEVLRNRLGFQGLVFSDDLSMEAAAYAGDHSDRARISLEAGCDMVLVCNAREQAGRVAESLAEYSNPVTHTRIARLHGRPAPNLAELRRDPRWQQAVSAVTGCEPEPEPELDLGL
jgi:beta-N-acetylhexosaminidase